VAHATLVVARGKERFTASLAIAGGRWRGSVRVLDPARWWPHTHGEPARYQVAIELEEHAIDLGSTGFRTIELDRDGGDFGVRVNGVRVFCRGACWTPIDPVTFAPSADATRAAIAQARDAGMNIAARSAARWSTRTTRSTTALDEHGILLWQDLMFANMDYPEDAAWDRGRPSPRSSSSSRGSRRGPCSSRSCAANSEGEQQAAMSGAGRERWSPALFHETFAVCAAAIGAEYVAVEHPWRRVPARRERGPRVVLRRGRVPAAARRRAAQRGALRVGVPRVREHPRRQRLARRAPRCACTTRCGTRARRATSARCWDFDDVRDSLRRAPVGVEARTVRYADHEPVPSRSARAATGEVMAQTFAEWRRARSVHARRPRVVSCATCGRARAGASSTRTACRSRAGTR